MKRKILLSVAVLLISVMALFSCEIPGLGTGTGGNETVEYTRLVVAEESLAVTDLTTIRSTIFNIKGSISVVTDAEAAADGEIVFGNSNRQITAKAIAQLDEELEKAGGDCGYIVYAEGKNVAVYWTDDDMKDIVLSLFLSDCVNTKNLVFEAGVVLFQPYTTKEYSQQKYWLALEAAGCDPEVVAALKSLNAFYNGSSISNWMANLWDDDIGGFYYSNSARDNEPYLPDLESTNQLTNWLASNGVTGGLSRNEFLPEEMKEKIVNFAKNMQCATDGYFYHPQWPQGTDKLYTDRYGRDLSWATGMISGLTVNGEKQYPYYCAPSGDKCEEHSKNGGTCDYSGATLSTSSTGIAVACKSSKTSITSCLREDTTGAVYKVRTNNTDVISTASVSGKPDYSSSAAFTQWLWDYNGGLEGMMVASGKAHNINALQSEIISKGFGDELVAFLDDMQQQIWDYQEENGEDPTGLWQVNINKSAVWGVLKYMPFYNSSVCGKAIDLDVAYTMIRTCTKVIELEPDDSWALNDMMNQWSSITGIISNISKHHGAEARDKAYEIVRENAAYRIENCIAKIEPYKLSDGTFAYTANDGVRKSLTSIYGVPISLGLEEGDVNGNSLVCSMYRGIFDAMNYDVVPLCTEVDGENFLRIIENLEPVTKTPIPKGETIDFEDGEVPTTITSSIVTNGYYLGIEEDPSDSSNLTLCFKSGDNDPQYGDAIAFKTTGTGGNCFIFETKIYFKDMGSEEQGKDIFQIMIGNFYMLTLGYVGDTVYAGYRTSTGTGLSNSSFAVGEMDKDGWCKIRLELYYPDSNDDEELKVKYFINDEYVNTDNNHWGKHSGDTVNTSVSSVKFTSRKAYKTEIYLDDCFFNLENKAYYDDEHDISDSRD